MSNADPHMQIARKLRSVETARTELVQQLAEVFRGIQSGNQRDLSEALGGLVGLAYFLAVQMGISPEIVDREVQRGLPKGIGQDGIDIRDYEVVQRYLAAKR